MRKHWRIRRPSPPMVVAMIALFIALGPAAYAAANTVFSTDIVDGEVKNPDIAANAVGSGKVVDNSIKGIDVLESSLTKVPSADKLDGIDSTGFVQGKGKIYRDKLTAQKDPYTSSYNFLNIPGFGFGTVTCYSDGNASTAFWNNSGAELDAWWFYHDDALFQTLTATGTSAGFFPIGPSSRPYVVVVQLAGAVGTATITFSQSVTSSECRFSAQALAQTAG